MTDLVQKYGEDYRELITDALRFLDENEPKWNLNKPINRDVYVADLVERVEKTRATWPNLELLSLSQLLPREKV